MPPGPAADGRLTAPNGWLIGTGFIATTGTAELITSMIAALTVIEVIFFASNLFIISSEIDELTVLWLRISSADGNEKQKANHSGLEKNTWAHRETFV